MRIWTMLLAVAILFALAACGDDSAGTPDIRVSIGGGSVTNYSTTDFGSIGSLSMVSNRVTLSNAGDALLTIGGLYCTQSNAAFSVNSSGFDLILSPGASTFFDVIFNEEEQVAGMYGIGVFFTCDDPDTPSWALAFTGVVN